MAIQLYWDDEQLTTLLCVFEGRWTWDELRAIFKTIRQITQDIDHEVAAIIDLRKMQTAPGDLLNAQGLHFAREMLRMGQESTTGKIFVVGASKVITTVYDTMRSWERGEGTLARVAFVDTVRRARELLGRAS